MIYFGVFSGVFPLNELIATNGNFLIAEDFYKKGGQISGFLEVACNVFSLKNTTVSESIETDWGSKYGLDVFGEMDVRSTKLPRVERDAYFAEAELSTSEENLLIDEEEHNKAIGELIESINYLEWATIDLISAKCSAATSDEIVGLEGYSNVCPAFLRSHVLHDEGFVYWTSKRRLKANIISDKLKVKKVQALEEARSARSILKKVSSH